MFFYEILQINATLWITRVDRILQPSIIYIDDAEKTFLKKVAKTDKTDPKRLKKDLSKIVKSIGPSDLVLCLTIFKIMYQILKHFLKMFVNL